MKITIFGAGGAIGQLLVEQALREGHEVKAYVRNLSKFTLAHQNLKLIQGELNDDNKITKAIAGADCVISVIGPPVARNYEGSPVLDGYRNMIKAMKSEDVKRFIAIATPSVKFEKDVPALSTKVPTFMAKLFLPKAYAEIVEIGKAITASGLDWTIVRFIAPNDSPTTGKVKVTFGDKNINFDISRADIANFILKQTQDNSFIHSMPIIGS